MQLRIVSCTNNSLSLPRRSTEFASPCVCLFPSCLTPTDIPVFVSSIQPAFRQISPRHALACTFVVHRYACVLFAYMCVDVLNVRTGASEVVFRGACRFFVVVFFPWCCVCGQALRKLSSSGVPVVSLSSSFSLVLRVRAGASEVVFRGACRFLVFVLIVILRSPQELQHCMHIDYIHDCVYYCFNYFPCSLSNYSQVNLKFLLSHKINVCIFELFAIFPLPFLHVDAESFSSRGGMLGSRFHICTHSHTRTHSHPRTHLFRRGLTFTLVLTFTGANSPFRARTHIHSTYSPSQPRTHPCCFS